MAMPVGSQITPSGFQAKPVKTAARRYSLAIQQAARKRRKGSVLPDAKRRVSHHAPKAARAG